jgi:choice-of-anchor B domain-containing protein
MFSFQGVPAALRRTVFVVSGLCLTLGASTASGQGNNVTLLSTVNGSGNDVWGYVSPSGREYALASNNSNVKFIEITNPTSPVLVAQFPHNGSSWGDVKTYKAFAYSVTESSSGIMVYDMSDIDNGNVTLVRTIQSSTRSHNVAIDEVSGFMYTLGSRSFSPPGTTTCWDLSNPSNPVRVGAASVTNNYQHDANIVTHTSGPYAGRQILYGASEGRGLEIYDVTDKNNPQKLSTTSYGMIGYNHQGWLSDDYQTFYANDELDELNSGITTRTLIFDVSDINNPSLAGTFTTGLNSIDHNLYYKDGFLFESNYTSGLRIINACDPTNLSEVGSYDTYAPNNSAAFSGAWSVFPFFPSGVCLINNNGGNLFIVDPSAAIGNGCAGACQCACNFDTSTGANVCDIFDFLAFQNSFVAADPCACDKDLSTGSGVCDIFDFLAFQNEFVGGCP